VTSKRPARPPAIAASGPGRKARKLPSRNVEAWQLPSGKRLAEFALASGFLAPPLMENSRPGGRREKSTL